ncbi:hypothetical protein SPRG_00588 [Saprolegnia parasitica CBS 223.65]|uniref:Uncharacterized protein n=1 Tax=Saprolegnia parasitica (strain CBS 223.65) TaxID=695850 RepID=A0A067CZ26_SAPPC|nr:hypothetical protein SPRG_00588 [Saprolegnia parasitica CBS 223.65]KDO34525.1 hypothetical protein SPRG_00588 [Saprolegnia parasitica CBS 223.65]|eukprot:XP_012194203.1 hypothetical protein SPRG_00588 [Saprolegnia parasitica CBS 223.65]
MLALTTAVAAQTCTKLTDPASPVNALLTKTLGASNETESVMAVLNQLPASVLTCFGSIDVTSATTALLAAAGADPKCPATLAWVTTLMNGAKPDAPKTDDAPWYSANFTDADIQKVCTPLTTSATPCFNNAIVPAVSKLIEGNACCTDLVADIKTNFGQSLSAMLADLFNKAVDVACLVQTPGFSTPNQTFLTNVNSYETLLKNGLAVTQIPNDQGCAAVEGNPFKTTTGVAVSDVFIKPIVPGACAKPVDAFVTYIASYPIVKTFKYGNITINDLFAEGKCVKGSAVKTLWADIPMENAMKVGLDTIINDNVCFHIANGFTGTCKTVSSLSGTPAGGDKSTTTTAPTPKPSSAASLSAFATMAGMAVLLIAA